MNNYRITFGGEDIDYKSNFKECRKLYPTVKAVMHLLRSYGLRAWWFFEPYAEITWIGPEFPKLRQDIRLLLIKHGVQSWKEFTPEDGIFADWYGLTPEERESGTKRYAAISKVAEAFFEDEDIINDGLGQDRHYMRACHVLANQLGINYGEESVLLFKRSTIAGLFWDLGHEEAIKKYEKMFDEKYMGRDDD